jgi:hypothetical protein
MKKFKHLTMFGELTANPFRVCVQYFSSNAVKLEFDQTRLPASPMRASSALLVSFHKATSMVISLLLMYKSRSKDSTSNCKTTKKSAKLRGAGKQGRKAN